VLTLDPKEKVLLQMRRHWFILVGPTAFFIVLLLLPSLFLNFAPYFLPAFDRPSLQLVIDFGIAVYLASVLTYMLLQWLSYYLDVWIITDQRIVDVQQNGLFHRTVSEITMDRIQDVTVEVPGFIPTMLDFGTIRIQTAGELGEFVISEVPACDRAKDIIIAEQKKYMAVRV